MRTLLLLLLLQWTSTAMLNATDSDRDNPTVSSVHDSKSNSGPAYFNWYRDLKKDIIHSSLDFHCKPEIYEVSNLYYIPCDDLIVDAGEDVLFNCFNGFNTLDGGSFPTSLDYMVQWTNIDGDLIAFPGVTEPTVFAPGDYVVTVHRISDDCEKSDTISVNFPGAETLEIGSDSIIVNCVGDGYIITPELLPSDTSLVYAWSGPDFDLIDEGPSIRVFSSGIYCIRFETDAPSCAITDEIYIRIDEPIESALIVPTSCEQADGSISLSPYASSDILSYTWSNGQTGPVASELAPGTYAVTLEFSNCEIVENYTVGRSEECFARVSGRVEFNSDCSGIDGPGVSQVLLHLMPEDIYSFTDYFGNYEFLVFNDYNEVTIEYVEEDLWDLVCPSSGVRTIGPVVAGDDLTVQDFYVDRVSGANFSLSMFAAAAKPGFMQTVYVELCNFSSELSPGVIQITHDEDQITSPQFLDLLDDYDAATRTGTINVSNLAPLQCYSISFEFEISTDASLGSTVFLTATALPVEGDISPDDNLAIANTLVTGSFDPNDKQNNTGQHPFGGAIYPDERLQRYQIRFQNTGTDTAFTVVIRDTLDEALDIASVNSGIASHDYELAIEGNNVLVFTFNDIVLPDSTADLSGSQGFLTFTIRLRPEESIGSIIENTAAIFFDFNDPVITNTVINEIVDPTSIFQPIEPGLPLELSPNPAKDVLTLNFIPTAAASELRIYTLSGQLVKTEEVSGQYPQQIRLDISLLPSAQYLVVVRSGNSWGRVRLVKQ